MSSTGGDHPTPTNLARDLPALLGRDGDLARIGAMLTEPTVTLLTLVGPGGVGKTSLAQRLARQALDDGDHPDGVFFVALAPVRDPALLTSTVAQALGIAENVLLPPRDALASAIAGKRMLLVLDNLEHLAGAPAEVAALLERCPRLRVLATSRAPLGLTTEREVPVAPLPLPETNRPEPAALVRSPAVALFVQRARAVRPDFTLDEANARAVGEICVRLDGLPLALELAAARIKLFSPEALRSRLAAGLEPLRSTDHDRPLRHRTLHDAIDWSYRLLSESEQALFRRLSVFVGGFDLEAVEAALRAPPALDLDPLEGVAALVDESLLVRDVDGADTRFGMLETVREYALERLRDEGERVLMRRRRAEHFLALAERAHAHLTGPDQAVWFDRLAREHDNLRAVLDLCEATGDAALGLRLGAALWRFWLTRGHIREGRVRLERLLALPEGSGATPEKVSVRARALQGLAILGYDNDGDYAAARPLMERSLALQRSLGDRRGVIGSLNGVGWIACVIGDFEASRRHSEEALELSVALGDERGEALALNNLGWAAAYQGRCPEARELFLRSLALRERLGDRRGRAYAETNLAWAEYDLGLLAQALERSGGAWATLRALGDLQLGAWALLVHGWALLDGGDARASAATLEESVAAWRQVGNHESLTLGLGALAESLIWLGELDRAEAVLAEGVRLAEQVGVRWNQAKLSLADARLADARAETERAERRFLEAARLSLGLGDGRGLAASLEGLAYLAQAHDPLRAARLAGAAEALRRRGETPLPPLLRERHARLQATLAGADTAAARTEGDRRARRGELAPLLDGR